LIVPEETYAEADLDGEKEDALEEVRVLVFAEESIL
jgi:hypothetical protein|tara:strand:+ start:657 stop:764 length:108 start_codon:yes stop_codon:yes gene_type:complete